MTIKWLLVPSLPVQLIIYEWKEFVNYKQDRRSVEETRGFQDPNGKEIRSWNRMPDSFSINCQACSSLFTDLSCVHLTDALQKWQCEGNESVCKVRTQDPENFHEEVLSLVSAWRCLYFSLCGPGRSKVGLFITVLSSLHALSLVILFSTKITN